MNAETKQRFFEIVFKDEETAKAYLSMKPEEVSSEMKKKGIDCTADEIKSIGDNLIKKAEAVKNGELSEDELLDVAGGNRNTLIGGIAIGVMIGLVIYVW